MINRIRSRRSRKQAVWSLSSLEDRVMLAADCGAAIGATSSGDVAREIRSETGTPQDVAAASMARIVFIDSAVDSIAQLADGLAQGHELVLLQPGVDALQQITETLSSRSNVSSIHIIAHGAAGQIQLGGRQVDLGVIQANQAQVASWKHALTADADILIYGCETGAEAGGLALIQRIAELTGADVAASTNQTGSGSGASGDADWVLERRIGVIESDLALSEQSRNAYRAFLPITVRAAGSTGQEQMLVQIDGETVATYDNVGTTFQDFSIAIDGVDADQVRVVFTNDLYQPEIGIDRNLRVDKITIDGVIYETEAPEVYSTGTWLPADGIVPGYRQSHTLHTNGYFQYAGTTPPPVGGDPNLLVINEIHYNPGPDLDGDAEFLELYNSGDQAVDLGGLSFTGFDLTFASGTIIGAGQYAIVAPSIALAESTWGVTPIAEFTGGGLSGGGELIQLLAADGSVIDQVDYLDEAPWTPLPDGNGPSLELIDWALDNSLATHWASSIGDPTPAAENSVYGTEPVAPITDIIVTPGEVLPDQDFTISATISGATTANLIYVVGFGEEQSIAMTSSVADVWEAVVPGADAGALIRYRIESDVAVAPFDDTINYFGIVVSPTDIVGNDLPLFQFFVDETQFTELTTTDLALTDTTIPAVVYFDGKVIDNATVRVRGGVYSRTFYAKKSLKFELPKGYTIDIGDEGEYLVDEFAIQADFGDWSQVTPDIAWDVFNAETDSLESSFFVRAEINGDFHGIFRYQNLYDGAYRDANGISDDDEFFKAGEGGFGDDLSFDKKSPDDGDLTRLAELNSVLIQPKSAAKTAYLYENVDIANVVNHMALSVFMRHDDQSGQNFYMLRNSETGLWSIVEWDLDRTFVVPADGDGGSFTTPTPIHNELLDSVFEVPEFQEMYWRRLQTIVDKYLADDSLVNRHNELIEQIGAANSAEEFAKWGRNDIYANRFWADEFADAIDLRRDAFAAETRLPGTATGENNIVINELHYNPLDGDAEFLELYNAGTESVDLSGGKIDAAGLEIGFGTVLLPGQYVVFSDNYEQFKQQSVGNIFFGGQYSGGLKGSGELVELVDADGNLIDSVDYSDSDPWPTQPDGNGFSLSLINPTFDNSLAESWNASAQINGTPGVANDQTTALNSITIFAAGVTGDEIITLDVAGQQVATFKLADYGGKPGDLQNRSFVELNWSSNDPIELIDVRVSFVNDLYDPENGIDLNVAIDAVEIAGVFYETEAPDVYSTGTYVPGEGIVPGFRESEILHSNGYFQFAIDLTNESPVAVDDFVTTVEGTTISGNVLENDSDADLDTLSVISNSDPTGGTVSVGDNGDFVYTPDLGFTGQDSFTYTVSDGKGGIATGTVSIAVDPIVLIADGNVIQMRNFDFDDSFLSSVGGRVRTSTTNDSATHWELIYVGDGDFKLRNVASGAYLDGDLSGIDTALQTDEPGTNWRFIEYASGHYYLLNSLFNGYIDASGSNTGVIYDPGILDPDDVWIITLV
ncbi:MAG: DUF4347 domain-containing protein [Planctomycetales bacterium]|nr:DUF4347 domain-containing protein [Planctomycetales bacterium]